MGRVFTRYPGDWGSIPGRVLPKTRKRVFDTARLKTLSVIRCISRVKLSSLRKDVAVSSTPPVCIEKGTFGLLSTMAVDFTYFIYIYIYIYICVCVCVCVWIQEYKGNLNFFSLKGKTVFFLTSRKQAVFIAENIALIVIKSSARIQE